jgi:hypothetical protein
MAVTLKITLRWEVMRCRIAERDTLNGSALFLSQPPPPLDLSRLHVLNSRTFNSVWILKMEATIVCVEPVIMKNDVSWDVTPCGSCKNQRFGGT